jgi:hypothetical protein
MAQHDDRKFKAYFSHEGGGALALYLVTDVEAVDFTLSAKLAEHVAPFVERGLLDGVMLLPASTPEELSAFFDPRSAFRVEIEHA